MKLTTLLLTISTVLFVGLVGCNHEVLDAFKQVNDGLVVSNKSIQEENIYLRDSVQRFIHNTEVKQKLSILFVQQEKYNQYLAALKLALVNNAKGMNKETGELHEPDNIDVATDMLVNKPAGDTLYQWMIDLSMQMSTLAVTDSAGIKIAAMRSSTKGMNSSEWSKNIFYHVPATAAVTILSKFENDERMAEKALLHDLLYNAK